MIAFDNFHLAYRAACIEILQSNTPKYFMEEDLLEYTTFLNTFTDPYFVILKMNKVVGCGGIFLRDGTAGLSWGMIHREFHKRGLGTQLLMYRLKKIREHYGDVPVHLHTTQYTSSFFQQHGFHSVKTTVNGFGYNLNAIQMVYNSSISQRR